MPTPKVVTGREMQVTAIELVFAPRRPSGSVERGDGAGDWAEVG
jgi:hypothetical protein